MSCRPVRVIGAGGDRTPLIVPIFRDCALNALLPCVRPGILLGGCSVYFGRVLPGVADYTLFGAIVLRPRQLGPLLAQS